MGETTGISWSDRTWSPWTGCTKVSPACDGCYAEHLMANRMKRVEWGQPGAGAGTRDRMSDDYWRQPLAWERAAAKAGERPFVFPSLCDPFDKEAPSEWLRDFFVLIRATPHLTWLLLTKRPQNIVKLFEEAVDRHPALRMEGLPRNAAIGCTVVTQEEADRDIPKLLVAKAALQPAFAFVSMEPLLGSVDLTRIALGHWGATVNALTGEREVFDAEIGRVGRLPPLPTLDWVITGGETDQGSHKARPSHPEWFRSLRDQCTAAGAPFHFKQWGEWTPGENAGPTLRPQEGAQLSSDGEWWTHRYTVAEQNMLTSDDEPDLWRVGKKAAGRLLDGVLHDARPEILA
jgi:protein gp37